MFKRIKNMTGQSPRCPHGKTISSGVVRCEECVQAQLRIISQIAQILRDEGIPDNNHTSVLMALAADSCATNGVPLNIALEIVEQTYTGNAVQRRISGN